MGSSDSCMHRTMSAIRVRLVLSLLHLMSIPDLYHTSYWHRYELHMRGTNMHITHTELRLWHKFASLSFCTRKNTKH